MHPYPQSYPQRVHATLWGMRIIILAAMMFTLPVHAQTVQVIKGECGPASNTAEGPLDSDLAKRTSKFFCNEAVITTFADSHVLIDFTQKDAHHSPILGFSGHLNNSGDLMKVENVYLMSGDPTTVSDGSCQLFFKDRHLTGIGCGMKVDEMGRRTVAIVVFNAYQ